MVAFKNYWFFEINNDKKSTENEIKTAIKKRILLINIESENEADVINNIVAGLDTASRWGVKEGELSRASKDKTFYILDEPTTGLHFEDINMLLNVLQTLVNRGNTVIVIEHNLDVIKCADWIIDLGPEGGEEGGNVLFSGTPENLSNFKKSYTGKFLKSTL